MKKAILISLLGITSSTFASNESTNFNVEDLTSNQLIELTTKCTKNDYKGSACEALRKKQLDDRERMQQEARDTMKYAPK